MENLMTAGVQRRESSALPPFLSRNRAADQPTDKPHNRSPPPQQQQFINRGDGNSAIKENGGGGIFCGGEG